MASPLIVFDLDGTLVDTAPDLVATLNTILAHQGLPPVGYEAARNMVGGGARVMLERGLAVADRKLPAAAIDVLTREFVDHYAAHIADRSLPFPGAEAALDELAKLGFQLAVCTNKLEWLSLRLLDALGLSSRFAAICGADTFGIAKPDPDILRRTISRAGGSIATSIMIGDSLTDIATARAAQVPVIAVDFGYTDTPVTQLSPDGVISHFGDLSDAIEALLGSRLRQT